MRWNQEERQKLISSFHSMISLTSDVYFLFFFFYSLGTIGKAKNESPDVENNVVSILAVNICTILHRCL